MVRTTLVSALTVLSLLWCGGCATRANNATVAMSTSSCRQPQMTLVETERAALQRDGDIVLTIAATVPSCVETVLVGHTERSPSLSETLSDLVSTSETPVFLTRRETSSLSLDRAQMGFQITINNQSERIFRGEGVVIQYIVNGATQTIDVSDYQEMQGMLVAPGQSQTVFIGGFSLLNVSDGATVQVALYDVAVERNPAGETTRRANFEWFFTHSINVITAPSSEKTCDVMVQANNVRADGRTTLEQLSADPLACP